MAANRSNPIGKGQFGTVYRPALRCTRAMSAKVPYVSKVMSASSADKELTTYKNIRVSDIDKAHKYYPGQPEECIPSDVKLYKENVTNYGEPYYTDINGNEYDQEPDIKVLNYRDGGDSLKRVLVDFKASRPTPAELRYFLYDLRNIFEAVDVFNGNGIYHCDINLNNIVYSRDHGMRLIDFGVAQRWPQQKDIDIFKGTYWPWPIEMHLLDGKSRLTMKDYHDYKMDELVALPTERDLATINSLSPEDILKKIDVWDLGVVLLYLMHLLWKLQNLRSVLSKVQTLALRLLDVNPARRPDAHETLKLYDALLDDIRH